MNLYIPALLTFILLVVFYNLKSSRVIYLRSLILPLASISFILLLITFSNTAVKSASNGLTLWLNVVFPSLFPFFVASEILNKTGFIKSVGILLEPIMRPLFNVPGCGSFPFAMGITSGYPVGAKLTASMREEKLLSKVESERLLSFTNNSGPLFIVGAVAVGMFKIQSLGLLLLTCHIFASITVGILFRFHGRDKKSKELKYDSRHVERFKKVLIHGKRNQKLNLGEILGEAISNSINVMLAIGGFIILFSVIINVLLEIGFISYLSHLLSFFLSPAGINKDIVTAVVSGFFEITTGTSMASNVEGAPFVQQLAAVSLILGWAGLSVHLQVYSIISKTDISIKPYLFGKMLQGIFSAFYILIAVRITGMDSLKAQSVFNILNNSMESKWYNHFLVSCQNIFISLFILLIFIVLSLLLYTLKRNNSKML
ncbi:MAG: sporulation integral membrane protein YlbJ [Bacillota bacterium]